MFKVLRAFKYADDGFHARDLVVGEKVSIREDVQKGLIDEGFIQAADGAPQDPGAIEIADNWQDLRPAERMAIAKAISGKKPASGDEANSVIEAEIARRAA